MMYLIGLLSMLALISVSSCMILPDKLTVLLCKQRCKSYSGCTSVLFNSKYLRCELIFGNNTVDKGKTGIRLFKVPDENSTSGCSRKDRIFYNKRGSLKCVKAVASKTECKRLTEKKEPCPEAATVKATDEGPRCILLKRENITSRLTIQLVELNIKLKPGMKMLVYGGSGRKAAVSTLTLNMDPKTFKNPSKWYNINIKWGRRELEFRRLFFPKTYKGVFPISDRFHFTLAFEVTQSEIKIYADNVQVQKIKFVPGIRQFTTRNFSGIHVLVVQKTGEECKNVNNGIP